MTTVRRVILMALLLGLSVVLFSLPEVDTLAIVNDFHIGRSD